MFGIMSRSSLFSRVLLVSSCLTVGFIACGGQSESPKSETTTGGDGDDTTSTGSSGDGDSTTGTTTTATSSGDGDSTTTGDGDGDTGGEDGVCLTDADCVVVAHTDAACYSSTCSAPSVATQAEVDADVCTVPWTETSGPEIPPGCQFMGEIGCPGICILPPACSRAVCNAQGVCELITSEDPNGCVSTGDATCQELEEDFEATVDEMAQCLAGGITPTTACDAATTVTDLCGCPRIINSEVQDGEEAVAAARAAYQSKCQAPERCQLLDCATGADSGHCELTEHPDGKCVFDQ